MEAVNAGLGKIIEFNIPFGDPYFDGWTWTISPLTPLPVMTEAVEFDGTTQTSNKGDTNSGGPKIVLDGSLAGSAIDGLYLDDVGRSTIRGLVISNWGGAGIRSVSSVQTDVLGCYVGTGATGTSAEGNSTGILLEGGRIHHIGGPDTE